MKTINGRYRMLTILLRSLWIISFFRYYTNDDVIAERHNLQLANLVAIRDMYDLIAKDLYVDKSLFIEHYLRKADKISRITRPSGWGKTTNLNTLKRFLEIVVDGHGNEIPRELTVNRKLFVGGEIPLNGTVKRLSPLRIAVEQPDMVDAYQGKYPVLYVSFENVRGNNYAKIERTMRSTVARLFRKYDWTLKNINLTLGERNLYRWHCLSKIHEYDLATSLRYLARTLYRRFGRPIYILIDHYETPLTILLLNLILEYRAKFKGSADSELYSLAINSPCFERTLSLIDRMLTNLLNADNGRHYERVLLCGIFDLNFADRYYSSEYDRLIPTYGVVDKLYSEFYGFVEEEVTTLLAKISSYDRDKMNRLRSWYAYNMTDIVLYNPTSIRSFLSGDGKYRVYWKHFFDITEDLLYSVDAQSTLKRLLTGRSIKLIDSNSKIRFDNMYKRFDAILLSSGYLCCEQIGFLPAANRNVYVPNREIWRTLKIIKDEMENFNFGLAITADLMSKLAENFDRFDTDAIRQKIEFLLATVPEDDKEMAEKYYEAVVETAFYFLEPNYTAHVSKDGNNLPRYLLIGKKNHKAIVFDYDVIEDGKQLTAKADKYFADLSYRTRSIDIRNSTNAAGNVKRILKIAIVFCGKSFAMRHRIEDC